MAIHIRRREFISTLFGGAAIWPLAAQAQQAGKVYHIGFLANDPTIPKQPAGLAFLDGLRENGFIEGKNVINPVRSRSEYEDNEVAAASHGKGLKT